MQPYRCLIINYYKIKNKTPKTLYNLLNKMMSKMMMPKQIDKKDHNSCNKRIKIMKNLTLAITTTAFNKN